MCSDNKSNGATKRNARHIKENGTYSGNRVHFKIKIEQLLKEILAQRALWRFYWNGTHSGE